MSVWPVTTMHGVGSLFYERHGKEEPQAWRAPDEREPYARTYRSCPYCGSIHPEDLYNFLVAGTVELHGADWKYGWPHKFYVERVPNPLAGKIVVMGGTSVGNKRFAEMTEAEKARFQNWRQDEHGWKGDMMQPAPAFTPTKFYNEHLEELSGEAFALFAPVLSVASGIEWTRDSNGRTMYRAPRLGYQKG